MIRLPIPRVDAAVVHGEWARWAHLPTHRLLTGVPPWQRDDSDDELNNRICTWPETEMQSGSSIGFADVTSHEQTTMR
jgi:hypothetical protein